MRMLKEAYRACRQALANSGIENADYEALCLIEHVTGFSRAGLIAHGDAAVSDSQQAQLTALTEKRLRRYPLQYLLGAWSFMGIPLAVGEGVLIPRDDTEVCTRLCLDYLRGKPHAQAFDLCAGSGAIALALERFGKAQVTAVELSEHAFYFLKTNIKQNNATVTPVHGDVLHCYTDVSDGSLDLIVSNPPYIRRGDLPSLQAEVQFEPAMALDGGEDGYDFYRAIIARWSRKLKPGGALVFELGEGQAAAVAQQMREKGFIRLRTAEDFGGCERAIIGIRG